MVIDSVFFNHFVVRDLREPEIFFEKEGAVEDGGVYFKIRDIGTLVLGEE